MVVIRFQRRGTKKIAHHRIVAIDRTRAQSGRVLEVLGYYNPSQKPETFKLDESRYGYWVSVGAQVSDSVASLAKRFKKIAVAAAAK